MLKIKFLLVLCAIFIAGYCIAQTAPTMEPTLLTPAEIKWGPAPDFLSAGAKFVVLYGDPGKDGEPYSIRLSMPSGYKIMPHFHPKVENVTVISGHFVAGGGDKIDPKTAKHFPAGSYASLPANMHHFAYAQGATVVQVDGIGPFQITYVNAADDPRTKKTP